ncbi:hypothetical protein ACFFKU_05665 [Kineococcus gynurae]|uniref:DUF8094 domain-containing protein n=1 Tax=Kineococcus gynurae TaxID=452979 RepID=A0ABV5LMT4_9ACTN
MSTRTRPTRRALGLALALGLPLAGCAQLPTVSTPPAPERVLPVVAPAQAARITTDAVAGLQSADPVADPTAAAERLTGPELDLRTAAARIAAAGGTPAATGGADDFDPVSSLLPRQEDWPRWFVVVTGAGADEKPSFALLTSESARTPYKVWATPSLLPGVSLPTTDAPSAGADVVAPDEDTNLVASPQQVAERYVDVLLRDTESEFVEQFAEDAFRSGVEEAVQRDTASLQAQGGRFEQTRELLPDSVRAVRTRDGGAIAFAAMRWSTTQSGPAGGRAGTLDAATAALAGREQARSVTVVRDEVVAFAIPAQGTVRVLAAQSGPVSAEAS